MIGASLSGLDELFAAFDSSGTDAQSAGDRAMRDGASALAEAIRAAAPEHDGDLAASVRVERGEDGAVHVVAGGTPGTDRGGGLDTALMAEYGTSHEAARPFFWPTVEAHRDSIKASADAAMSDAVEG